eukprot:jgi/Botrbrau1/21202/Bobra.39_2s0005.1
MKPWMNLQTRHAGNETPQQAAARLEAEAQLARDAVKDALESGLSNKRKGADAREAGPPRKRSMLDDVLGVGSDTDSDEDSLSLGPDLLCSHAAMQSFIELVLCAAHSKGTSVVYAWHLYFPTFHLFTGRTTFPTPNSLCLIFFQPPRHFQICTAFPKPRLVGSTGCGH